MPKKQVKPATEYEDRLTRLYRHYTLGTQDMDTRRVRKNGWNDVINAYMSKVPTNWPYNSVVTLPLIRTTILEKNGRLLNAKLQGRLVPRDEAGDYIKAKINNNLLDFQWDMANEGGSMFEKVALADQYARMFGASFALTYWDVTKNSNEIKIIDPRDIFFDGSANHIRNARWVQIREFTTFDKLAQRGFDVKDVRAEADNMEIPSFRKDTVWYSVVKGNRGLTDRTGEIDDLQNPIVEVVTEWGVDRDQVPYCTIFLPKFSRILSDKRGKDYPYEHGKLPIAMLRYYPLLDDIYGESEVEGVLPLQRAANAMVCGFLDEANIKIRPPLKIAAQGVRIETIEYGPGAKWIMNDPSMVQEHTGDQAFLGAFNTVFPMIITQFNDAMGDKSMGVTQTAGGSRPSFGNPTATEVKDTNLQQNQRDQSNQNYLAEFLKEIMLMWLLNNKQFLFDDPTKKYFILKIIGKDKIKELQTMQLDGKEIPEYAMNEISDTVMQNPEAVSNDDLEGILSDVAVPTNPIITNPEDEPSEYNVKPKLNVLENGEEAELYILPEDFEGEFDYIPDVKSMSAGAGQVLKDARSNALMMALNPQVSQMLQTQGDMLKIKDILIATFEDAGFKDAEALFQPLNGQTQPTGQAITGAGQPNLGGSLPPSMGQIPQAVSNQPIGTGIPQPQGLPGLQPNVA